MASLPRQRQYKTHHKLEIISCTLQIQIQEFQINRFRNASFWEQQMIELLLFLCWRKRFFVFFKFLNPLLLIKEKRSSHMRILWNRWLRNTHRSERRARVLWNLFGVRNQNVWIQGVYDMSNQTYALVIVEQRLVSFLPLLINPSIVHASLEEIASLAQFPYSQTLLDLSNCVIDVHSTGEMLSVDRVLARILSDSATIPKHGVLDLARGK